MRICIAIIENMAVHFCEIYVNPAEMTVNIAFSQVQLGALEGDARKQLTQATSGVRVVLINN